MSNPAAETVPEPGQWPVDPQQGIEISKARIWIDGCFDFSHHGMSYCTAHCREEEFRKYGLKC